VGKYGRTRQATHTHTYICIYIYIYIYKYGACTLHYGELRPQLHTQNMHTYCYSKTTIVTRTRLNVAPVRSLPILLTSKDQAAGHQVLIRKARIQQDGYLCRTDRPSFAVLNANPPSFCPINHSIWGSYVTRLTRWHTITSPFIRSWVLLVVGQ